MKSSLSIAPPAYWSSRGSTVVVFGLVTVLELQGIIPLRAVRPGACHVSHYEIETCGFAGRDR